MPTANVATPKGSTTPVSLFNACFVEQSEPAHGAPGAGHLESRSERDATRCYGFRGAIRCRT
jgi:hypothetical protein